MLKADRLIAVKDVILIFCFAMNFNGTERSSLVYNITWQMMAHLRNHIKPIDTIPPVNRATAVVL
jgi:hypothetical protein